MERAHLPVKQERETQAPKICLLNIQEYSKTGISILNTSTKKSVDQSLFHSAQWQLSTGKNRLCHSSLIILKDKRDLGKLSAISIFR